MKLKANTVVLIYVVFFACLGPQFGLRAHTSPHKIASVQETVNQGQKGVGNVPKQLSTEIPEKQVDQESGSQRDPVETSHSAKGPEIGVNEANRETQNAHIPDPQLDGPDDNSIKTDHSDGNPQKPVLNSRPCMPHDAPGYKAGTGGSAQLPSGGPVQVSPPGETTVPETQAGNKETEKPVASPESPDVKASTTVEQVATDAKPGPAVDTIPQPEPTSTSDQVVTREEKTDIPSNTPPPEGSAEPAKDVKLAPPTDDIGTLPKSDDDILSFDEWKEKKLAEHSQQLKSKQLEAQSVSESVINGKTGKLKASSSRHNYAALTCGAKVLATNQEAVNPSSILTENKDQYMIQPCKAKKWFVVELCEIVQVRNIEIANLELFSSLPETFVVHVSDRYPSKEWKALGTFHARDARAVQTFSVSDEELFAKYMKVEMQSHYGNEHYCPLTLLRVYGVVEEEEDDGDPGISPDEDEGLAQALEGDDSEPDNLFKSAKDTVMKLVKNVLNPAENQEEEGQEMKDVVHMNTTLAKNASRVNGTTSATGDMLPCLPGQGPEGSNSEVEGDGNSGDPSTPIVRHMGPSDDDDAEPKKSNVVTLIETPSLPLNKMLSSCTFCSMPESITFLSDRSSTCGYYRALIHVPKMSCITSTKKSSRKKADVKESRISSNGKMINEDRQVDEGHISNGKPNVPVEQKKPVQPPLEQPDETVAGSKPSSTQKVHNGADDIKPTGSIDTTFTTQATPSVSLTESVLSHSMEDKVQPSTSQTGENLLSQPTRSLPESSTSVIEDKPTVHPDHSVKMTTEHIIPSSTETTVTATDVPVHAEQEQPTTNVKHDPHKSSQIPSEKEETPPVDAETQTKPTLSPPSNGNGRKDIYAEEAALDRDLDLEGVEVPDLEEPVQKLSSAGKQTTFMRLKNRIKALELNLNLSSRYLEELSQRYKKQMEEMYTSINSTITRLSNTSRASEERYQHQRVYQKELQEQIYRLTANLTALQANINGIHSQVIERHLYLMMFEAVVFILVLTYCLSRTPKCMHYPQRDKLPSPDIPQKPKSKTSGRVQNLTHQRRNSVDATPPRPKPEVEVAPRRSVDDIGVNRRSESEDCLPIVQPTVPKFVGPELNLKSFEGNSKKRRRKKNQMHQSSSSSQLLSYRLQGHPNTNKTNTSNCIVNGDFVGLSKASSLTQLNDGAGDLFETNHLHDRPRAGSANLSGICGSAKASPVGKNPKQHQKGHQRSNSDVKPGRVKTQARLSLDFSKTDSSNSSRGGGGTKSVLTNGTQMASEKENARVNCNGMNHPRSGVQHAVLTKSGSAEGAPGRSPAMLNGNAAAAELNNSGNWKHWFPGLHKS